MAENKPCIELSIYIRKEYNQYHSWCPELDVASWGDTFEEARENLSDAVDLYLKTLSEEGELERVLQERDIKPFQNEEPYERPVLTSFRIGIPVLS